jgi:hypothetical protein
VKPDRAVLFALLACALCTAAASGPLPEISRLHPRIFVRNDAARLGRGMRLIQLKERLRDDAYTKWRRPNPPQHLAGMIERAARYLETGDAGDLDTVRTYLSTHTFSQRQHDVGGLLAGAEMAIAYDWVFGGLSDADRQKIVQNIITTADSSYEFLAHGEPDVNHNYTYMALQTVAICGLVLHDEPAPFADRARDYLLMSRDWIEGPGKVLDTWKARQGAWGEGSHYTFHETIRTLMLALQAYRTASDTDYFARIEKEYGDFAAKAGLFMIASTRPDLTFERIGDVLPSRALANLTVPLTIEMIAAGCGNDANAARLRSFSQTLIDAYGEKALNPAFDWGMRIFHDAHAHCTPSYQSYPKALRLGAGTYEHIVFRNGWSEASTMVTIIAGDHYTDHQHFDKGQFLIYHRGGLIVDSGTYDDLYRPEAHWTEYACRTLAHNCLLVYDRNELLPRLYGNDGGQRILRGLQHHGDWNSYLNHYRAEKLDAGNVEAWEYDETKGFGYVRCNLTGAYSDKVSSYDRQFVYLPGPDYLVVADRVRAAGADLPKRWLLHFQEAPQIDGTGLQPGVTEFPGAKAVRAVRGGSLSLGNRTVAYDGRLLLNALLPEQRKILAVGGPGYEYYNTFRSRNYPPNIADRAREPREAGTWRIEIAPEVPSADDMFLNAIQIADGPPGDEAQTQFAGDPGRKLAGVQFEKQGSSVIVLLGRDPGSDLLAQPLEYEVKSGGAARHYIAGLPPSRAVAIDLGSQRGKKETVSPQGVLSFEDPGSGLRKVRITAR